MSSTTMLTGINFKDGTFTDHNAGSSTYGQQNLISTLMSTMISPLHLDDETKRTEVDKSVRRVREKMEQIQLKKSRSKEVAELVINDEEKWYELKKNLKGNSHMMLKHQLVSILDDVMAASSSDIQNSSSSSMGNIRMTNASSRSSAGKRWTMDMLKSSGLTDELAASRSNGATKRMAARKRNTMNAVAAASHTAAALTA